MPTLTIKRREWREALTAVLPHAGDDLSLPVIAAVQIECDGKGLTFVATDRYTLGVYRHDFPLADDEPEPGPFTFLLRRSTVADSLRLFPPKRHVLADLRLTIEDGRLTLHDDLSEPELTLAARAVDGEYPKWRSIMSSIREKERGLPEGIALNPHYMARWAAASPGGVPVRILTHGQTGAVILSVGERFMGVQMPVRTEEALFDADRWAPILDAPKAKKEKAA